MPCHLPQVSFVTDGGIVCTVLRPRAVGLTISFPSLVVLLEDDNTGRDWSVQEILNSNHERAKTLTVNPGH